MQIYSPWAYLKSFKYCQVTPECLRWRRIEQLGRFQQLMNVQGVIGRDREAAPYDQPQRAGVDHARLRQAR